MTNSNLIQRIAEEFDIKQGIIEPEDRWKARVVYSMLGRMACASMLDSDEDEQPISVVHFKSRIKELLSSYIAIFPELHGSFGEDFDEICDEIYGIYLGCGYIYHSAYHITLPCFVSSRTEQILFTRGSAPGDKQSMSGLGTYTRSDGKELVTASTRTMFQLPEYTLDEFYSYITKRAKWSELSTSEAVEYLRVDPPFSKGYWLQKESGQGDILLARTGNNGNRTYYLYKVDGSTNLFSQLPAWLTDGPGYRRVSNSILSELEILPPFVYATDGPITTLSIQYLPAEEELNCVKLYSWPTIYTGLPHDFTRIFDTDVFFAIKEVLESIGYKFEEQNNV